MAYGNLYYLDFYDRFSNQIKVYIQQEDYVGAVVDVTGGGVPLRLHWIGEGDDKYRVIKGSTAEFNVMSTSDQMFVDLFTDTSRKYKMVVYNGSSVMWTGFVDPDSYKEPFLYHPYVSTIHASDGLGELKNIEYPMPEYTQYYNLYNQVIYTLARCLQQTGHELDIYVANNVSFNGASNTAFEDIYHYHRGLRDDENNFIKCYDVVEYILKSFGCRLYQWMGSWYIERIDYLRTNVVDYEKYDSDGVHQATYPEATPTLNMTGVDGSPMCVWVNQSPEMEIVPAWKSFQLNYSPGELKNILTFTDNLGIFADEEFERPAGGPYAPRYWTYYAGSPTYGTMSFGHLPDTEFIRVRGVGYPLENVYNVWGNLRNDAVTLSHNNLLYDGSLKFRIKIAASINSDNPYLFLYKPFFRWNLKMTFPDSAWEGSMPTGHIKSSPGDTLTIYFYEDENGKFQVTTATDWMWPGTTPLPSHPYPAPGVNTCQFDDIDSIKQFTLNTEPIRFAKGYSEHPTIEFIIYPLTCIYFLDDPAYPTYPGASYTYNMDVYQIGVQLVGEMCDKLNWETKRNNPELGYEKTEGILLDSDNRYTPSVQKFYFTEGLPTYNDKYYHKYIFVDSSGDKIEGKTKLWTVDGTQVGDLIGTVMLNELRTQYVRPMRKLTGELCADPDEMDFGKILVDPYSKKYYCTGVEYDAKNAFWNGEWAQLYDPATIDAGDFDADDFSTGDFWAI